MWYESAYGRSVHPTVFFLFAGDALCSSSAMLLSLYTIINGTPSYTCETSDTHALAMWQNIHVIGARNIIIHLLARLSCRWCRQKPANAQCTYYCVTLPCLQCARFNFLNFDQKQQKGSDYSLLLRGKSTTHKRHTKLGSCERTPPINKCLGENIYVWEQKKNQSERNTRAI